MAYTRRPLNPLTPFVNQVVVESNAVNDNFDLLSQAFLNNDPATRVLKSDVYTFRRVDLSNATSDYNLQVGEEAVINFTNAITVPLRIATQSGTYYEMDLISFVQLRTGINRAIFLNPNNTTYSNAFLFMNIYHTDDLGLGSGKFTYGGFRITWAGAHARVYIHNITVAKSVKSFTHTWDTYRSSISIELTYWNDTTTAWTSLGTIVFPQAYSGYILVRRLA